MTYILPILLFLALVAALRWMTRTDDDAAAGVLLGPETLSLDDASGRAALRAASPGWPTKHFISACMYCHRVTTVHGGPAQVRTGDELRVSHGICDPCMAERHPEVAAVSSQPSAASLQPA